MVSRETGPWASSSGVPGVILGAGGEGQRSGCQLHEHPTGGPRPRRTCLPWQDRVARVGMGQSPPWGAEERFCGIGSLAKIWAEKFRLGQGRSAVLSARSPACPATHKQNCNTRKNGSCPLGKKRGSRHHSLCTTARRGCPTSTHTQYCEQKHGDRWAARLTAPRLELKALSRPRKNQTTTKKFT